MPPIEDSRSVAKIIEDMAELAKHYPLYKTPMRLRDFYVEVGDEGYYFFDRLLEECDHQYENLEEYDVDDRHTIVICPGCGQALDVRVYD